MTVMRNWQCQSQGVKLCGNRRSWLQLWGRLLLTNYVWPNALPGRRVGQDGQSPWTRALAEIKGHVLAVPTRLVAELKGQFKYPGGRLFYLLSSSSQTYIIFSAHD